MPIALGKNYIARASSRALALRYMLANKRDFKRGTSSAQGTSERSEAVPAQKLV